MNSISLLKFAKTIASKYSNQAQAQKDPNRFAHINIFFRPIPWNIFDGPGFYSEQSYDYAPWSPYRQSVHKLFLSGESFVMENYQLKNPERVAGAGFNSALIKNITGKNIQRRNGCDMYFKEVRPHNYIGEVSPGKSCLINRAGKVTYLVSRVEFNQSRWESLDQGFSLETNQKIWGSDNGPLKFKRILSLEDDINKYWLI